MNLRARLSKLEQTRPAPVTAPGLKLSDLALPPDLCARIKLAYRAGTYPQSLCDDDLLTIIHAVDNARGQT